MPGGKGLFLAKLWWYYHKRQALVGLLLDYRRLALPPNLNFARNMQTNPRYNVIFQSNDMEVRL